ncbi:MAG: IS5/IS1182 family transposase [Alphaproteobacteria bacterium]|nr:MAG: IS5/IS1182 family transposase [Alphaproteobacteria bacterium]
MNILKVLRARPALFFRLCGIRLEDFDDLLKRTYPLWLKNEHKRLSHPNRKRAIGAGRKYELDFPARLLMCLIYYRTYTTHVFLGLVFGVSSPTVCRVNRAMTYLLADHFRMPEREVRLSEEEKDNLLYLMVDGTERPIPRSKKPGKRKKTYSGKKKKHTVVHQIITDNKKRILSVGPAQKGSRHDKRIFDESRVIKPPDMMVLGDLGYLGTGFEIPIKKPKKRELSKENKRYNRWHSGLRVGVEHAIGRMKKFRIFADIHRNNGLQNMIAKNVGALANINLKTV